MAEKSTHFDYAVVGAGALGLNVAYRLSEAGYRAALIESGDKVANRQARNNGRVLHDGPHPLATTRDEAKALYVAKTVRAGARYIKEFSSDAVGKARTYAVFFTPGERDLAVGRWDKGEIVYEAVPQDQLDRYKSSIPQVSEQVKDNIIFAAEIPDQMFDPRVFYAKLARGIRQNGVQVLTGATFIPGGDTAGVLVNGEFQNLNARGFIITTGHNIGTLYREVTGRELPLEYWKVHFLTVPGRVMDSNFYPFRQGQVTVFSQGDTSILSKDQWAVQADSPDTGVIPELAEELRTDAADTLPGLDLSKSSVHACVMPKVTGSEGQTVIAEPWIKQHGQTIFALPGKLTSTPVVAQMILDRLGIHSTQRTRGSHEDGNDTSSLPPIPIASYPYEG